MDSERRMSPQPIAEVTDLCVKYGDTTVLSNVTASFEPSQIQVILGTSGCGKTTLLKTMVGLLQPAAGTVRLFGQELKDIDSPATVSLLRRVGVLFQNGALLGSLTTAENIALPLEMHTDLPHSLIYEMVHHRLAQVGLPHAAPLYPSELSGGMRKRAALARALALEPPLLFCDEPYAGLDPVTSAGLDELLLSLRETLGITMVVVTHELASIETIADNIVFLHQGALLFSGPLPEARQLESGAVCDFFARKERRAQSGHHAVDFSVESVI
jgi:phospholipid/cholesterol/gamma-HCH transport system ATP-binding protein